MTTQSQQIGSLLRQLADAVDPPAPPPPPPAPKTSLPILTDARLAAFRAMQQANSPAWQELIKRANLSKTSPTANQDDCGLFAAIAYRVTGDPSYELAAWSCLLAYSAMPASDVYDSVSDSLVEIGTVSGMLAGTGTAAQWAQFKAQYAALCDIAVGRVQPGGIPATNANYCVPDFGGCATSDALYATNYLTLTSHQSGFDLPMGGLDATAADRSTARNCIKDFVVNRAAGGVWPELPQYDTKTVPRLVLMWAALADILGVDHFPEVAAWIPHVCDAELLHYTNDFRGAWPGGDLTRSGLDFSRRLSMYVALQNAAMRIGDTTRAASMGWLVKQVLAAVGGVAKVDTHYFFFADDLAPAAASIPSPLWNYSPGVGLFRRNDGGSQFAAFFPVTPYLNHEKDGTSVWLYANGEPAVDEPSGYALQLDDVDIANQTQGNCYGSNSIVFCGLTKMQASGWVDHLSTNDFSYLCGQTQGLPFEAGPNTPSKIWLNECARTVFYLPSLATFFICDRVNLNDPRVIIANDKAEAGKYGPYLGPIKGALHLVEQVWHCPIQPRELSLASFQTLTWNTPGGQQIELDAFSPTGDLAVDIEDESQLWANVSAIASDQKKWQFRVRPAVDQQWNVIVTCVRVKPDATAPTKIIQANAAGFQLGSTAVLFSTDPANRLLDPATAAVSGAGKTYLVGCSGNQSVVVK